MVGVVCVEEMTEKSSNTNKTVEQKTSLTLFTPTSHDTVIIFEERNGLWSIQADWESVVVVIRFFLHMNDGDVTFLRCGVIFWIIRDVFAVELIQTWFKIVLSEADSYLRW